MTWIVAVAVVVAAILLALNIYSRRVARRSMRLVPADGRTRTVAGGRIHWVELGEGPPVVLIHGLSGQLRNFTFAMAKDLARDHRVIALDRPGSGYSTRSGPEDARLSAQARAIAQFLHDEGVEAPVVVGHSLGGAVALALAAEHPGAASALALIAPLTHPVEDTRAMFRPYQVRSPLLREALAQTIAVPLAKMKSEEALEVVFAPEPVVPDFLVRGGGALGMRPAGYRAASEDLVTLQDDMPKLVARYPELTLPVGILFGSDDRILDPALHGDRMAERLPGVTLRKIGGAGHMLPLTRPAECSAFVREMVAARRAPPGPERCGESA